MLAATDLAQPYGGTLPWPPNDARPARAAGALVVLSSGRPLVWFDQRSHHVVMFPAVAVHHSWADALAGLVKDGRQRSVEVRKIDGETVPASGHAVESLKRVGFVDGYRGLCAAALSWSRVATRSRLTRRVSSAGLAARSAQGLR